MYFREDCGYESVPVDPFVVAAHALCGESAWDHIWRGMRWPRMIPRDVARLGLGDDVKRIVAARAEQPA